MSCSAESKGVACIKNMLVLPLKGVGGKLGIVKLSNPHRIPSNGPSFVENKCVVNDFVLDPFDEQTLVALCDNGNLNIWKLDTNNDDNFVDNCHIPEFTLKGHLHRPTLLNFHCSAKNIIASSDSNGETKIWDLNSKSLMFSCHNINYSQITGMSWEPNGKIFATTSIDKYYSIFDPRNKNDPCQSNLCSENSAGSKVEWIGDNLILISTLTQDGRQVIKKYDLRNPKSYLGRSVFYSSPAPYLMHYEPDNNLIYFFNKGGNTIQPIELRNDNIQFFECNPFKSFESHQTVAFFQKNTLNVKNVEIAKSIRIMNDYTEIIQHKLLRTNEEYFQDDIYPPTLETWIPSMTSSEWLNGKNIPLNRVSLAPNNMKKLSENLNNIIKKEMKYNSKIELLKNNQNNEESKIIDQFKAKIIDYQDYKSPDIELQGISDSEWDD